MNHKLDSHKEIKSSGHGNNKGKYKHYYLNIYIPLKDNQLFK